MIERNNPYNSIRTSSLKKTLKKAKVIVSSVGASTTIALIAFSGCSVAASEIMKPIEGEKSIPVDTVVFDLEDGSYYVEGEKLVEFKDRSFRDAMGDNVDYYSIYLTKDLSLYEPDSLEELKIFSSLDTLSISECYLEDMSMIKELKKLSSLSIYDCDKVKELSFLNSLPNLKKLTIDNCESCTIDSEVFNNLSLNSLDISFMPIEDLDFISGMNNLTNLTISGSNLNDISSLSNLYSLKSVDLKDCLITDCTPLYTLSNLEYLDISNNSIDNLDLSKFPNLRTINIKCNYSLYRDDFIRYCRDNFIQTDITQEDVDCMNQIRSIVAGLNLEGLSEREKEKIIYSYVLDNMEYDNVGVNSDAMVTEYNERALYHALLGKGVCANYAYMFDAMCDVAGIDTFSIKGYGVNGSNGESHAWNLVEIDGQYMLCDPTWSDTSGDIDKYFNASGAEAEDFTSEHMENSWGEHLESATPRSNMAINGTGVVKSIKTDSQNAERLMSLVIEGISDGSIIILGAAGIGLAIRNHKKRKKFEGQIKREAEVRNGLQYYSDHNKHKH